FIRAVIRISARIERSIMALCERGLPRVFKIIALFLPHITVRDSPEVDPDLRILMCEKRRLSHEIVIMIFGPLISFGPSLPKSSRQRICFRAEPKQIEARRLVVTDPSCRPITVFRTPFHAHHAIARLQHERPINPPYKAVRELANFAFGGVG